DAGEPGHQRGAVLGFELGEPAAVHDPGDDLVHVVRGAGVRWNHPVQLVRVHHGLFHGGGLPGPFRARPQGADDAADDAQRVGVVLGQVVGDAGDAGVQFTTAEL